MIAQFKCSFKSRLRSNIIVFEKEDDNAKIKIPEQINTDKYVCSIKNHIIIHQLYTDNIVKVSIYKVLSKENI